MIGQLRKVQDRAGGTLETALWICLPPPQPVGQQLLRLQRPPQTHAGPVLRTAPVVHPIWDVRPVLGGEK